MPFRILSRKWNDHNHSPKKLDSPRALEPLLDAIALALTPSASTNRIWLDAIRVAALVAIQFTVIPSLLPQVLSEAVFIDLVTPWVIFGLVCLPLSKATLLVLWASFLIETHSTAPMGLYFCLYWICLVAITLSKAHLSYRQTSTWTATFLIAGAGIGFIEMLFSLPDHHWVIGSFEFVMSMCSYAARVMIVFALGLMLVHHGQPLREDQE